MIKTVVIPARMASSRYPGKPLVRILGVPLVEHVRRRSSLAQGVDHVVVATCDTEIKDVVEANGGVAVMTKNTHERAADRVEEAMRHLPGDIVAMVQGDEPLLNPEAVAQVVQPLLDDDNLDVVNLLSPLETPADYNNANVVKAVCSLKNDVIFLTRAPVPFFRKNTIAPVYRQTGIMAFRTTFLHRFSTLPPTPLEVAESVDMLRVLEHGMRIGAVVVDYSTLGVDQPSDVPAVESVLKSDEFQRTLFEQTLEMGETR